MSAPSRYQLVSVAILTGLLAASLLQPIYPREQFLQHGPTVVAIAILFWVVRQRWLSDPAMTCIVVFLALHVVGARYIYSYVPWGDALTWLSLGGDFPARNHYDRLVHLAFGGLAMLPTVEIARRFGGHSPRWACLFAFGFVLSISAAYEVFEWMLTILADPRYADNYNGQQGDAWDAQKDMALAAIGALAVMPLVWNREVRAGRSGTVSRG